MNVEFERTIVIKPGFDNAAGFHGCEMIFILRGPQGLTTFACFTDWFPKTTQEATSKGLGIRRLANGVQPTPLEFAFHSPKPLDTVRNNKRTDCPYIEGECYSSYSPQTAEYLRDVLLVRGSEGVWSELEQRYRSAAKVSQLANKRKTNVISDVISDIK